MNPFICNLLPSRVLFGQPAPQALGAEVERLGLERLMMLSTPGQAAQTAVLAESLGGRCATRFSGATLHTPVEVTAEALNEAKRLKVDGLVAYGGGSTVGLSKAIALRTGLPQIAIPTTYAGSEATPILGQTEAGIKTTQRDPRVLPQVVIYDVSLTLGLSVKMTATSGLNALAHAVEALYAQDANPISTMMATAAIQAMIPALRMLVDDPHDPEARAQALYAAWLCGAVLGQVGMALHHKLCHTLGGAFDLPHAETHSVLLPHVVAFNRRAAARALAPIADALGGRDEPSAGLFKFAQELGAPMRLSDIGMPADGIDHATELAMANRYWNPRKLDYGAVRKLIANAYEGTPTSH